MATIDSKEIVNSIIAHDGYYEGAHDEPRALKIVEYDNAFGGVSYGVVFEGEFNDPSRYEIATEFVRNPRVIWRAT